LGILPDGLDAIGKRHTLVQDWQLVVAIEPAPAFLDALDRPEHHLDRAAKYIVRTYSRFGPYIW
jgi:hypothetical protein